MNVEYLEEVRKVGRRLAWGGEALIPWVLLVGLVESEAAYLVWEGHRREYGEAYPVEQILAEVVRP